MNHAQFICYSWSLSSEIGLWCVGKVQNMWSLGKQNQAGKGEKIAISKIIGYAIILNLSISRKIPICDMYTETYLNRVYMLNIKRKQWNKPAPK
jgi:hypothetical protein